MSTESSLLTDFATGLLDPNFPVPGGITTWNDSDPEVRFGVYRNNLVVSLAAALADGFPVTRRLVGEEFFLWMAREYILAEPPRSPVLIEYGDGFSAFIAGFPPAAGLPYLAELAHLERLRVRAYHAADAEPVPIAMLAHQLRDPEQLPGTRLRLHPSLHPLISAYAVVSIWMAHQGTELPGTLNAQDAESALVLRRQDDVLVVPVSRATANFVDLLTSGLTLGEAAAAMETAPDFDLTQCLALLIRHDAIIAWQSPGDSLP